MSIESSLRTLKDSSRPVSSCDPTYKSHRRNLVSLAAGVDFRMMYASKWRWVTDFIRVQIELEMQRGLLIASLVASQIHANLLTPTPHERTSRQPSGKGLTMQLVSTGCIPGGACIP